MATQEKTWNVANRLHSLKDSDNPEVNHIIAGADEIYDDTKGAKQSDINAQTDTALADRYTKAETYSKEQLDSLITTPDANYVNVVATNATTTVTDILPATGEANTIYRVGNWNGTQYDPTMYALFAWNGTTYVCLAVRSFVGEVYDVSVNHPDGQGNPTPYADLTAALGTDGENIPADIRRGGMRIQFIQGNAQSSDNKYVQYRLMNTAWSNVVGDWQGVDKVPTPFSNNLVNSGSIASLLDFELLNILDQYPNRLNGYYEYNGRFIDNDLFEAVDGYVQVAPKSTYLYTGRIFGGLCIVTYDASKKVLRNINIDANQFLIHTTDSECYLKISTQKLSEETPFIKKFRLIYINSDNNNNTERLLNKLRLDNLIEDKTLLNGYYSEKSFISNDNFRAVEDLIELEPYTEYCYNGCLFGDLTLSLYDENQNYITSIGKKNHLLKVKQSILDDRVVSLWFKSSDYNYPYITKYVKVSWFVNGKATYPVPALYKISRIDLSTIISKVSILEGDMASVIPKEITSSDLTVGFFYRGNAIGERTEIAINTLASCYIIKCAPNKKVYIRSTGNEEAPSVMFLDENMIILFKSNAGNIDATFTAPVNTKYVVANFYINTSAINFLFKIISLEDRVNTLEGEILPTLQWTIPRKIYAIKGQEKSVYLDNIVNRNEDAPNYCLEVNKSFGDVDSRRFYFTPDAVGNKSVIFNAWDTDNVKIDSKTISFEVLNNELSSSKRICCIGDSITEGQNMPYYIEEALKTYLTQDSVYPTFVGTNGGTSGMASKPTKHEGWYGRDYQWLATMGPFINPDTGELDIEYYRIQKLGLSSDEYIDVVSLAMGFNGTTTESDANRSFTSMQSIISAFKADNADTKFIVHLVTYPAMGNVNQPNNEEKIAKKNSLYYFRQLCIEAYNNNQDNNIIIGDLGLGYDRWYAYPRSTVHPAIFYTDDNVQIITDRVHPTAKGARQMGENVAPCILYMLQQ